MTTPISPSSHIDPRAEVAFDVEIGPYCHIGPDVRIGQGTRLLSHVCILGDVTLGQNNAIGPFVCIGDDPQDVSYRGAATRVEIGDQNVIHQGVTIHRGSEKGEGITRVGDRNVFKAGSHVAHDCQLGDRITIAERSVLGGHVRVGSDAAFAGGVAVVHNVTIGRHSFVRGQSKVTQDLPPYMLADGYPATVRCVNAAWLRRNDFREEAIAALREAHRLLYRAKLCLPQAAKVLDLHGHLTTEVLHLIAFVEAQHAGKNGRALDRAADLRIEDRPTRGRPAAT